MSDALKLSSMNDDDDELLSPLCKAIVSGSHRDVRPRDDRADEIADLKSRITTLENPASRKEIEWDHAARFSKR